ncbi:hypothetical protein PUN28_002053 [Cardiocondyla obscurior]|uniref:Uncharacterized protein n=1 Tax=Cardiocondyla obscurior TaxID=286306 RepID=A0AAW2GSD2_9HYME
MLKIVYHLCCSYMRLRNLKKGLSNCTPGNTYRINKECQRNLTRQNTGRNRNKIRMEKLPHLVRFAKIHVLTCRVIYFHFLLCQIRRLKLSEAKLENSQFAF